MRARDTSDRPRVADRHVLAVVAGDQAAHRHTRKGVQAGQHHVEDVAAHVLEVTVDAVRGDVLDHRVEFLGVLGGLVVHAGVEAEFLDHVVALLLAAGHADHAAAGQLGQLAHHAAHRAGRGADHDGLAAFGAMILFRPYQAVTPGMPTEPR